MKLHKGGELQNMIPVLTNTYRLYYLINKADYNTGCE